MTTRQLLWQGANASNLLDFQRIYNAKVITLTENYRSTQEILDTSHRIGVQISDSFAKQHKINKNLTSVRNDAILKGKSSTLITRHEFLAADAEYYWVAKQIHELVESGEEQSKIAIITPKHKFITPLLPYLKAYPDLNIAYEKRENILEDSAIHQLSVLARFVYELSLGHDPSEYLLEICSFPCWELDPLATIITLQHAKNDSRSALEYLQSSDDKKIQTLSHFFAQLAMNAAADTSLELLINQMTGIEDIEIASLTPPSFTSPFLAYYTANDASAFHLYELLSVLREHIKSHTNTQNPKLADFITFLDDYTEAGEAIINTSPYQDSTNAVQILTAHKSKGLEFGHVFLVATDDLSWGKAKGNNNLLSLPKNLIQIRHTGITDDERLRLFFVAITRAEKTLTITNSISNYAGKTPNRLEYLEEYLDENNQPVSPLLPNTKIVTHYDELSEEDKQQAITHQWLSAYQTLTPAIRPILEQRIQNYRLTASALTKFIDIIYAGPLAFYREDILRAPTQSYSETLSFGNLVHYTFEAITNQHLSDEQALDFFKQKTLEEPIPAADLQELLDRGTLSLNASLKTFGDILRAPNSQAEVNFSHEYLALPIPPSTQSNANSSTTSNSAETTTLTAIPITGKIDHINLNPNTKTIEVYDFKTSNYHPEKWNSHPTLFKYKLQLGFYKLLLNLSPTYQKYKVTRGHILFVSPDPADHQVYDKIYEYTSEDETFLKELMAAIYSHIKALDFIEPDSPLAIPTDTTHTFRDIKDFIQLLLAS